MGRQETIRRLLESQAELQTALGLYRLAFPECSWPATSPAIEARMQASLAMQHEMLALLGEPMYQPTQMPEGWKPA